MQNGLLAKAAVGELEKVILSRFGMIIGFPPKMDLKS
jgi:hypothetical protein